jgi:glycosyl-4,4'-diaponeurosporenoate acyltransferase
VRLIHLPTFWTVLVDFMAWFIIHIGVAFVAVRVPARCFGIDGWLFKSRDWEHDGQIYSRFFKIRKWKAYLPDAAPLLRSLGFPKKRLAGRSSAYFLTFVRETCRAEATHWIIILFAPLFFLWNPLAVGFFMILYALAENVPLIMAQRYNRARFRRLIKEGDTEQVDADNGRAHSRRC